MVKTLVATTALFVLLGCTVPQPTPEQKAAATAAVKKDQADLDGAIRHEGVVYVAQCSEPFTVIFVDEKGIEQSSNWAGRFWYSFNPTRPDQPLKIEARRSSSSLGREGEVWVQMYANGKLVFEDHKSGSQAYDAVVVAHW